MTTAKKNVVLGTPINPAHIVDTLGGYSFCVSYATRQKLGKQLDQIIDLVNAHPGTFILIDNGAFSHWTKGGQMDDDYIEAFEAWALDIQARCTRAIAVIPDVIDGNHVDNAELVNTTSFDSDRAMPIWHLHEPLSYLQHLVESGFLFIGFGSSGEFASGKGEAWEARIQEALDLISEICTPGSGYARPQIHMMRAQSQHHKFDFFSSDSTNVAVNHGRYKATYGDDRARYLADRIRAKIEASGALNVDFDLWEEIDTAEALRESCRVQNAQTLSLMQRMERAWGLEDAVDYDSVEIKSDWRTEATAWGEY